LPTLQARTISRSYHLESSGGSSTSSSDIWSFGKVIEPYMPSHFVRQFGNDQIFVGNPNTGLRFSGNLFEGAQAWYYSVTGG